MFELEDDEDCLVGVLGIFGREREREREPRFRERVRMRVVI